ncbi:hypothetical protein [Acidovorax temperans]|uniref:hypothetical protein n=1 Tax=Acidovorax temperans TaxID=80878 RepID=UPI00235A01FA|nr:hypothetical protein [Acidovorax temperans]WCT25023.1 hypothetical protein PQV96_02925 [Acidovorax temperans]
MSLFKGLILKQRFKDKAFLTLYRKRSIKNKLAASSLFAGTRHAHRTDWRHRLCRHRIVE